MHGASGPPRERNVTAPHDNLLNTDIQMKCFFTEYRYTVAETEQCISVQKCQLRDYHAISTEFPNAQTAYPDSHSAFTHDERRALHPTRECAVPSL
jgi:hypothetical protein